MKMDETLLNGLNEQLNHEFYSAYLYFAMATYFVETGMVGFAKTMKEQAKEELDHARRIYDYLILRGEKIVLAKIEAPDTNWVNPLNVVKEALTHEEFITDKINELYKKAVNANDIPAKIFLSWFVEEQIEEESKFKGIIERIRQVQECSCEIVHIDRELRLEKNYME